MADFKIALNLVANDSATANVKAVTAALREYNRVAGRAPRSRARGVDPATGLPMPPQAAAGRSSRRSAFGLNTGEINALAANMEALGRRSRQALLVPVTLASNFESAILKVDALSGGTMSMEGNLSRISAKARELGKSTEFTATEAAEAFQIMTQAGFSAEDQINSVGNVLDFATFGQVSMAKAADLTGAAMGAFGLEGSDAAERVGNTMARIAVSTQANVADVGATFRKTGQLAKDLSLDMENVGTAVSVLGKSAIRGGEAGTALKSIMSTLSGHKSDTAKLALKKLGITRKGLEAALNSGDLKNVFKLFAEGFAKKGITQAKRVGLINDIMGKFHGNKFSQLVQSVELPEGHANSWDVLNAKVKNTDITLNKAAETMRSGTKGSAKNLESAMEELGIVIGEKLLPTAQPLIEKMIVAADAAADWANKNSGTVKTLAQVAAGLAIAGPLLGTFVRTAQTLAILSKLAGWQGAFAATTATAGNNVASAAGKVSKLNIANSILGGFITGYALGTLADQWLGISDAISGANRQLSIMQGMTAGFGKRQEKNTFLGDLTAEERGQLDAAVAERDKLIQERGEMGFFTPDLIKAGHDKSILEAQSRINTIQKSGNARAGARAQGEADAATLSKLLSSSLSRINRSGVDALGGGQHSSANSLKILVKVDEQGKYVETMVDEMTLDAGITVEGL